MVLPSEIGPLLTQAWEKDPEEHFFEFLADVFQTNASLYALADITHDQVQQALQEYMTREDTDEESNTEAVEPDPQGDTSSEERPPEDPSGSKAGEL